jgi:hypothetical protein
MGKGRPGDAFPGGERGGNKGGDDRPRRKRPLPIAVAFLEGIDRTAPGINFPAPKKEKLRARKRRARHISG